MIKSIDLTKELTDAKAFGETAVQRGQAMGLALPFVLKEHFTDFQLIKGDKGILILEHKLSKKRYKVVFNSKAPTKLGFRTYNLNPSYTKGVGRVEQQHFSARASLAPLMLNFSGVALGYLDKKRVLHVRFTDFVTLLANNEVDEKGRDKTNF
ncbi:hypothetical protein Q0S09_22190 [Escherichia coli O79:H4]